MKCVLVCQWTRVHPPPPTPPTPRERERERNCIFVIIPACGARQSKRFRFLLLWPCWTGITLVRFVCWINSKWLDACRSCHKYHFCRDKTRVLSRQKHACRNKHNFVATKLCLSRQNPSFVATKVCLSRQIRVCRDKYLSRQNLLIT